MTASKVSVFEVILVRIQSECGKIRTRITPIMDTFHAVQLSEKFLLRCNKISGSMSVYTH